MPSTAAAIAKKFRVGLAAAAVCADTGRDCPLDGNSCEPGAHTAAAIGNMAGEAILFIPELDAAMAAAIGHAGRRIETYIYQDDSVLAYCDDGYAPVKCWVVKGTAGQLVRDNVKPKSIAESLLHSLQLPELPPVPPPPVPTPTVTVPQSATRRQLDATGRRQVKNRLMPANNQ